MKRFIVILLACIIPLISYADKRDAFGIYGFCKQETFELFQQYVNQKVVYLPCAPLNFAESTVFKTQKFIPEYEYVITDISPKKGGVKVVQKMSITFEEVNSGKVLKIKTDVNWVNQLPFIFIEKFNFDKAKLIGSTFKDPLIKGEYKVTDVRLDKPSDINNKRIKIIQYYVSNPEINRSFVTDNLEEMANTYLDFDTKGRYQATLVRVEKPENPSEKYGKIKTIVEDSISKYAFDDEMINIMFFASDEQLNFDLKNESQYSIKILWEEAAFVDYKGTTSKIKHLGVRNNEIQSPSTIIKGSSLIDCAIPVSNSVFPEEIIKGTKQIRLMLPIQIQDVVNEYIFIFDIKYVFDHPERINLDYL